MEELEGICKEWQTSIQELIKSINDLDTLVQDGVQSEGKGYMMLCDVEKWIDSVQQEATNHGSRVTSMLREVQHLLEE